MSKWLPEDYNSLDRFYQQHYDKLIKIFSETRKNGGSIMKYRYIIEEATLELGTQRVYRLAEHYKLEKQLLNVCSPMFSSLGSWHNYQ